MLIIQVANISSFAFANLVYKYEQRNSINEKQLSLALFDDMFGWNFECFPLLIFFFLSRSANFSDSHCSSGHTGIKFIQIGIICPFFFSFSLVAGFSCK